MLEWFKSWNLMRILRFVMAVFIIFQGIETEQWLFVIAGFIFALLPLFNIGCCRTTGCNTNFGSNKKNQNKETTFTEIK